MVEFEIEMHIEEGDVNGKALATWSATKSCKAVRLPNIGEEMCFSAHNFADVTSIYWDERQGVFMPVLVAVQEGQWHGHDINALEEIGWKVVRFSVAKD